MCVSALSVGCGLWAAHFETKFQKSIRLFRNHPQSTGSPWVLRFQPLVLVPRTCAYVRTDILLQEPGSADSGLRSEHAVESWK